VIGRVAGSAGARGQRVIGGIKVAASGLCGSRFFAYAVRHFPTYRVGRCMCFFDFLSLYLGILVFKQLTIMGVQFSGVAQLIDAAIFVDHHAKWKEKLQTFIQSELFFLLCLFGILSFLCRFRCFLMLPRRVNRRSFSF